MRTVLVRFTSGMVIVALVLFGSAGSFGYRNGWLFLAVLFAPMIGVLALLWRKHRSLLEKRMRVREKEKEQKAYVGLSLLWFAASLAIPGLDYRFGWSLVPGWLVAVAALVMLSGYALFVGAMVQNAYASRVIEIQEAQHVVDTGLYAVVRHPMYMSAVIMFTACPLVLGSYYALIPALVLPPLLAYRIRNEERVLRAGLAGYAEYESRVRFRLIPFVW